MKIVCAPDKYKDCLSAIDVADAMAAGIRRVLPDAEIDQCPLADGGEGTVDTLLSATGGRSLTSRVCGPRGERIRARWGIIGNDRVVLEVAAAAGLNLVPRKLRDPRRTTSYGVGELIIAACRGEVRQIVTGLGGSATVDGGCGMAQALGYRFPDARGRPLPVPLTGGHLMSISRIVPPDGLPDLAGVQIIAACDVDSPLLGAHGAARVFAPQKGADPQAVAELEAGLAHLAELLARDLGCDVAALPGAGAAGGLGAGLAAFAGARLESGIRLVLDEVDFVRRVSHARLCLTGEGRLDGQSLAGKVCVGVAREAAAKGVPTIALVGAADAGADATTAAGLTAYRVIGPGLSESESRRRAPGLIAAAAGEVALAYARQ